MQWLWVVLVLLVVGCSTSGETKEAASTTTTSPTTTTTATTTTTVPTRPPVVAALGDSLLFSAQDELRAALPTADARVYGVIGLTTDEGHFGLAELLEADPVALAVVLGTNDALDGEITEDEVAALDDLAELTEQVPCVWWVELGTTGTAAYNAAAQEWNRELARAAAEHGFTVLPWSAIATARPEWLALDGVHHSTEGELAFGEAIASRLSGCPTVSGSAAGPAAP